MECLTEFTCSVYVDGELPERELREVEEHLETCHPCRGMAAAFREESRLLVHYIQEIDLEEAAPEASAAVLPVREARQAQPVDVLKFGGLLVALATLIRLATSSPENLVLPSIPVNVDWINPSDLSGRLNWLVGTIVFFVGEGLSRMMTLVEGLSVLALYVLILAGVVTLVRRSASKSAMVATLGTVLLIVAMSSASFAMDVRNVGQDKSLTIPAGQTVDDNLFATGDVVIIDGTINGDLIAFARQVVVHGTVKGNVITAAQSVIVEGTVEGSIIAGGQSIQFNGKVAHNAIGFSQSATFGKDSDVSGDAYSFVGNEAHVNGNVAHNYYAFGFSDIAGTIGRNVVFRGAKISVYPTARIGGNLTAYVPKPENVNINQGATVGGKQTIELPKPGPSPYTTFKYYFSLMLRLAASFVTGLVLYLLLPQLRRVSFPDVVSVLKSGGIGFITVVAMPVAAFLVAITLIGLPVAIVGFVVWLLGLYVAKIIVANFVGRTLLRSDSDRMSALALNLLVGLVLVFVVINLPFVGGLMSFLLNLVGFGALAMGLYDSYQASHGSGR